MQLSILQNSAEGMCSVIWQLLLCLWLGLQPGLLPQAAQLYQQQQKTLFRQSQASECRTSGQCNTVAAVQSSTKQLTSIAVLSSTGQGLEPLLNRETTSQYTGQAIQQVTPQLQPWQPLTLRRTRSA